MVYIDLGLVGLWLVAGWLVLGVGVPGCRGAWGWDRRCQDPGAQGLGPGGGGVLGDHTIWGGGGVGGSNTEHGTIYRDTLKTKNGKESNLSSGPKGDVQGHPF